VPVRVPSGGNLESGVVTGVFFLLFFLSPESSVGPEFSICSCVVYFYFLKTGPPSSLCPPDLARQQPELTPGFLRGEAYMGNSPLGLLLFFPLPFFLMRNWWSCSNSDIFFSSLRLMGPSQWNTATLSLFLHSTFYITTCPPSATTLSSAKCERLRTSFAFFVFLVLLVFPLPACAPL